MYVYVGKYQWACPAIKCKLYCETLMRPSSLSAIKMWPLSK
jgi:hypothetical protein